MNYGINGDWTGVLMKLEQNETTTTDDMPSMQFVGVTENEHLHDWRKANMR